jgi:glyoxylase-like metal-dependent hydrolase (beta-lactamase superfamily II)
MVKQVVPGLWQVPLGPVNANLADDGREVVIVDTGLPGSAPKLEAALGEIGRKASDVRSIVVTHAHPDHAGSAAALRRLTGAAIYMHHEDAELLRRGVGLRAMTPSPGMPGIIWRLLIRRQAEKAQVEAAEVEALLVDGGDAPGGFQVIHVPGHCAGQVALYWPRHGGVLIAADTAANQMGLGLAPAYEDLELGRRSLQQLAALDFEVAVFGHGKPIPQRAAQAFRARWAPEPAVAVSR